MLLYPFQTFQLESFVLNATKLLFDNFKGIYNFTILAVRLAGGSYNAGRVEVYYNGTWGTVCDDNWGIDDARVVCRQLGFHYALNAYRSASYGQGTGPILLDNVRCRGPESSLFSCSHRRVRFHKCDHSKDASVRCGNTGGENN